MSDTVENYKKFGYHGNGEAENILRWAVDKYHPKIALACSFELPVLVHMISEIRKDARIFSIDTGRLPEPTLECAQDLEKKFGIKIEWYAPKHDSIESLQREKGVYSFRESIDARKECCAIRKVEPLNRALSGLDAWISGLRREQRGSRTDVAKIHLDEAHGGILKINPLADWTSEQVKEYVVEHEIPYNKLLEQGYMSIGCTCCTRPVQFGQDPRSGRWWWEDSDNKECGIHIRNWNI